MGSLSIFASWSRAGMKNWFHRFEIFCKIWADLESRPIVSLCVTSVPCVTNTLLSFLQKANWIAFNAETPRALKTTIVICSIYDCPMPPFELRAPDEIDWIRPNGLPSGFETLNVYTCARGGAASSPMEIATTRYTQTGEPTLASLKRIHTLRQNQRVTPVLIATILSDGRVSLFEPTTSTSPTRPIELSQANRFLQAILDEATPVAARSRLQGLLQSLDTTAIPGIKNSGLFANHELRNGVPRRADWQEACSNSRAILSLREHELIAQLGYSTEGLGSHALVLTGSGIRPEAIAVMLTDREAFDANSQRFSVSPVAYGLKMAEQAGVSWLILVRGGQLRLYPARIDLGVGRKGLAETFLELDLPQLTDDNAGYLSLIFASPALVEGGSAFQIMVSSSQYAVALGGRLRDKIYEDIVPRLSVAIADQLATNGHKMDAEGLDLAYQLTLRVFFRMLFQVYAEDRKLLPYGENERYDRHALKTIAKDIFEDPDQAFDGESTSMWDDLAEVWRVIDTGDRAWGVPAYNGGLFASDAELNLHGAIIHDIHVSNDVIGPCLKALLLDRSDDGEFGPVDFRSLSVREFGTIYEGLLESSLSLAEVDLTLDRDGTWLPAKSDDLVEARAGDVYFHNTSGQRKGTGSYFTKSFVVEHLLERTLSPALDVHLERVAELIRIGDQAGASDLFFDFRVADLAMGSGHFLTSAIDHIERKMAAFLEEDGNQIPGVTNEILLLGKAATEAMGDIDQAPPEGSSLLRRQIARRCIYGLDVNPIAVELARVAIWIHTFVRGLPMSSLAHNLVCANSLTGIGSTEEALDALVPHRLGRTTLFDEFIEDALSTAKTTLLGAGRLAESNRRETQEASRAVKRAHAEAQKAKLLFDAAVLKRIGKGSLIRGEDPDSMCNAAALDVAQAALAPLKPGHMPVLFPEVFLRSKAGFDVLIGNPPWEGLHVRDDKWWGLRIPGLHGMPKQKRDDFLKQYKASRPDLVRLFDEESAAVDSQRLAILGTNYPGLGSGHIDLYQAFAWRNLQLLGINGRVGLVLPRTALTGSGLKEWRKKILDVGDFNDVTVVTNTRGWVFDEVEHRYSISFVCFGIGNTAGEVAFAGPFQSHVEFDNGRANLASVSVDEFSTWSPTWSFPLVPNSDAGNILRTMRRHPSLVSARQDFSIQPTRGDLNDKSLYQFSDTPFEGSLEIWAGASFNIWDPRFGSPYAYAIDKDYREAFHAKLKTASRNSRSAYFKTVWATPGFLPIDRARIGVRWITNQTNSRTAVVALLPPGVATTDAATVFFNQRGDVRTEAYILGVMSSLIFDWYVRRWVEMNLTFEILNSCPVPFFDEGNPDIIRIVEIAGILGAVDMRYEDWANSLGTPVGSALEDHDRSRLISELDARVAHLYGLERHQVEELFSTFHRGWAFQNRLEVALGYFDAIEKTK